MGRIPASADVDIAETSSARPVSTSPDDGAPAGAPEAAVMPSGSVLPWQPPGQRAQWVRTMLDRYTAGRRAALGEVEKRAA